MRMPLACPQQQTGSVGHARLGDIISGIYELGVHFQTISSTLTGFGRRPSL